jgi:hypothetical protein
VLCCFGRRVPSFELRVLTTHGSRWACWVMEVEGSNSWSGSGLGETAVKVSLLSRVSLWGF